MKISPSGSSKVKNSDWQGSVEANSGEQVNLKNIVTRMREKKLISKSNRTDVDQGIFQAETRELTMFTKHDARRPVVTPRLEGVTIKTKGPVALKNLEVRACSVPAAVAVISLDKQAEIRTSKRLLLIFATDALNTNMSFRSSKRNVLVSNGRLPVLMKTGTVSVVIANSGLVNPEVYALRLDGSRAERIPATYDGQKLALVINTGKLQSGPTPFFEICGAD
jgi:hypothetical protein